MNTIILREEILWLLEAIREQYEVIKTYEEKIPQIEFDILMGNVRNLYEKLHLLNRTNDPFEFYDQKPADIMIQKPTESAKIHPQEIQKTEPSKSESFQLKFQTDDGNGNSPDAVPSSKEDPWQNTELFNTEMPLFAGKLQEARNQSLGTKSRKSNPQDLKALISINEKFLFINELFDGNLREYNENLETLNRYSDFKSALGFLDILRKKNLWNSESIAFNKLKELLEQRFR